MATKKFRYLPHTADIAFVAYGKTYKEILENAALALLNVMFDISEIGKSKGKVKTIRVTERASDNEDMLWFMLEKVVSKVDQTGVNAFKFKVNRIRQDKAGIAVDGCIFYKEMKANAALIEVKAVTPHGLSVRKTRSGYSASVLVDV